MQIFLNPIIAMLFNIKEKKWHPILFLEDPLPGPPSDDKPVRHKSKFHHTEGFPTREQALKSAEELANTVVKEGLAPSCRMALDDDTPWDGEGIPASVTFFVNHPSGDKTKAKVAF